MKKIETLVEDIYDLFNLSPIERDEKEVDELIDKFGDMLKVHIKEFMYSKPRDGHLRLSGIGKPNRQLWYDVNTKTTEESLPPSTRIKFLYGYILEELLLLCAEVAGHTVEAQQKEVSVEKVKGHIDCIIDGELVDVKSASPYGFKKFVDGSIITGEDPFGYMYQLSSYGAALGKKKGYFLSIDKSGGNLNLLEVPLNNVDPAERISYLKDTLPDSDPPDRCYPEVEEASGNKRIGFNCKYCDYKVECWKDSNNGQGLRKYNYAKGPEYFTHIQKEPRVCISLC